MEKEIIENLCHKLRTIIMKPLTFQNAEMTLMDAHTVNYFVYDWNVPHHSHPWYEFIYIISGSFVSNINGNERIYSAGEAFLIAPGISHSHSPNGLEFSSQFCIRFQLNKINDNSTLYEDLVHLFANLEVITKNLELELLSKKLSSRSSYKLISGLWDWLLSLCDGELQSDLDLATQPQTIVYQANLYIEKNYMEKINAEKISQLLNVSYRTLARHYKNETGITINKKINDVRLNNAKALLLNTNDNIHNIALQVGYSDEYYFSSIFKKENKLSPVAFRKKFKIEKQTVRLLNY